MWVLFILNPRINSRKNFMKLEFSILDRVPGNKRGCVVFPCFVVNCKIKQ